MNQRLGKSFVRGQLLVLPMIITLVVLWGVLRFLDGFVPFDVNVPGLGLVLTLAFITAVGVYAGKPEGKAQLRAIERFFARTPVVKSVYAPVRDLLHALFGDRKSFDKPIVVDLTPDGALRAFGFVTCERFDDPQLDGFVAVYLPQSYNIAGNMLIVRRERVHPVDADSGAFMAFIVSGGVADMPASGTEVMDLETLQGGRGGVG